MQKTKRSRPSEGSYRFFVTMLFLDKKNPKFLIRDHTLAFYETFKDAERSVLKYAHKLDEGGYYNHAVIEKVGPGLVNHFERDEVWFKVGKRSSKKIPKPKQLKKIVCFSIG